MTDPTSGLDINAMLTIVGGGIGTAIAAFAIRMGWKNGGSEATSPTHVAEIQAAMVDSSSVKVLAGSIEALGFNLLELKKIASDTETRNSKILDRLIDSIDSNTDEIRNLSREIREHAREISNSK